MKRISILKEPWSRIFGIPIVGFMLAFVFNDPPIAWPSFVVSITITGIMWQADYMIIQKFRRKWPNLDNTHKRLFTTVGLILLTNTSLDILVCQTMQATGVTDDSWLSNVGFNLIKNLGATFIIGSVYEAGYFFSKWQAQTIETEQI